MCQFKSAIVLKDRVYVPDHDHHSDMLEELGIPDDFAHASKVFVRVEVSPTDGDILSDVFGWKLKVDQDILPDWWDEKAEAKRVKDAIKAWCDVHILRSGNHVVKKGVWYACDSSTVTAFDSSTVTAYGSSTVTACDSSTVKAYNSSTVEAFGSSTVTAFDSSIVTAYNSSTVTAFDRSTVTAYDSSTVKAYNSSTVKAFDSSTVTAFDRSTVTAFDSSTVKAYNSSTVTAFDSSTVKAFDSSTVILPKLYQTCNTVDLNGEAICVNYMTKKIKSPVKWEVE